MSDVLSKVVKFDRRTAARYPCEVPVALRLLDDPTIRTPAISRDIGSGGIFLYSNIILSLSQKVMVTLKLPREGHKGHLLALGRVVRVEEAAGCPGLAITIDEFALF